MVDLPLSMTGTSDIGFDLDARKPDFNGSVDDLRGNFGYQPQVIVMSGRAAEAAGDIAELDKAGCVDGLTPGAPGEAAFVPVYRGNGVGGTYCFATGEGRIGAFTIKSIDYPSSSRVTIDVLVWA
ncbi:hypothetical protein J5X84_38710 [Streptosporangiaceae bacterium NEAU-GS5]|nr:hypothetical protein [Streptosporangiaceae bacterium NEAU-GS5]